MEDDFTILRKIIEGAREIDGKICLDSKIFDILLRIIGRAVASMDLGDIKNSREILSELGEIIYRKMKSLISE